MSDQAPRPVALITGGNRGIGRAIVVALARRGFDVAFVDREANADSENTRSLASAAGAECLFIRGDISDPSQHQEILQAAWGMKGQLNALVNNAGISAPVRGDVLQLPAEEFDLVMNTNFRGTFFLTQACARRMLTDRKSDAHRSIVTVTSVSALVVSPDRAAYCCSKTALSMMVKIFAVRLAREGIGCYELRPGIIRTSMTDSVSAKYDKLIAEG